MRRHLSTLVFTACALTLSIAAVAQAGAGTQTAAAPDAIIKQVYAVVNADGTLNHGRFVTSSQSLGTGSYEVIFSLNVTACVYEVSVSAPAGTDPPSGEIAVTNRLGNVNGIFVTTFNIIGTPIAKDFQVIVVC